MLGSLLFRAATLADRQPPAAIEEPIRVGQCSWWTGVGATATITIQMINRRRADSAAEGRVVIRKIHEKSTDGWSRRTVAEDRSPITLPDAPDSVASALSGEARAGWDPWEVWLRRIDRPRRLRGQGE
jgi:hypothetical protein